MKLTIMPLILMCVLAGCAHQETVLEPINLAGSAQDSGSVLFDWTIDQDLGKVVGYYVVIDDHKPILADALNKVRVILASGSHTINVVSVAAHDGGVLPRLGPLKEDQVYTFGKPSTVSFFISDGGAAIMRYRPPQGQDEEGQLAVL